MEPWREGASCHKELRSWRVVAVGVNSIGEEINVRKVIPPGFIMILREKKETLLAPPAREREGRRGRNAFWPPEEEKVPHLQPDVRRMVLMGISASHFQLNMREELSRLKNCYTNLRSQGSWNQTRIIHCQPQWEVPSPSCSPTTRRESWVNQCVLLGLSSQGHADTKAKSRDCASAPRSASHQGKCMCAGGVSVGVE